MQYDPPEIEMAAREEHRAWLRLAEARDRHLMNEGEVQPEEYELLHSVHEEWREALDRLHRARLLRSG